MFSATIASISFKMKKSAKWAGVDRGALVLIENGIEPVFSVGDFDSVNDEERQILKNQLNIHPVKAEKDDTDLALGVEKAVEQGYSEIIIYGATGGKIRSFHGRGSNFTEITISRTTHST